MDILLLVLMLISIALSLAAVIIAKKEHPKIESVNFEKLLREQRDAIRTDTNQSITALASILRDTLQTNFTQQNEHMRTALDGVVKQLEQFEKRLGNFATENTQSLENIRKTVDTSLQGLREDNNKKLDEMRKTVDEKLQSELQKRMNESFAQVQGLMERLQKDIGSMRNLADDVGGLKKSLTNIKTRGMMGEFQLENILRDIFPSSQYEKNAHTNPDEPTKVVEFAVKIPTEDDCFIYLPIDSKFPQDKYQTVISAMEDGDKKLIEEADKFFKQELRRCADEINKYIAPPYTTDYAIMFLPTESMYSYAVEHGMLEDLWKRAKVYIAGPSTVAALLSSMQLSFNNLAIRKRANEVFAVLTEVSNEFNKFADTLEKMQKHLKQTDDDLTSLIGTRTKQMQRKLSRISQIALGEGESDDNSGILSLE